MSYGIKIYNADGRIQVNSDDLAPNTYIADWGFSAYSAMTYPVANTSAGDLTLARPANYPIGVSTPIMLVGNINNGQPTHFWGSSSNPSYFYQNTAGINTALIKTQLGNISPPANGEYGLDVYAADNQTILFSATRSTSVRVLAQGVLPRSSEAIYTPPSGLDFNKIYAMVNSTSIIAFPASFLAPSWSAYMMYRFYHGVSVPYIKMENKIYSNSSEVTDYNAQFPYMLVYDTN
tara:strand:+ start:392 stop:1093 length:702 start_codon:yes stop_codon:yes gene_type:complete